MMNKIKKILSIMLSFSMMFSCVQTVGAAEKKETEQYDIYPIVRDIEYDGTEFTMDSEVNVVYGEGIDDATKAYLEEVLTENGMTAKASEEAEAGESNIILNVNGLAGGDFAGDSSAEKNEVCKIYPDVDHGQWYEEFVQFVHDHDIMTGNKDTGMFNPNGSLLRQQFVMLLWNMEGKPVVEDNTAFEALEDADEKGYYADALRWAYSEGIMTGVNGKYFKGSEPLKRQQLAKMLYEYAEKRGYDVSTRADYSAMENADQVADYAKEYMAWAVGTGMITGKNGTDLAPMDTATRAAVAKIIKVFSESIANAKIATVAEDDFFEQNDAYTLETKEKQIKIVGKDSDAVFRGIATLKMMLSSFENNKLLGVRIKDYAGIEFRGFIEGFYGGWDYETRAELMEFARDVKMNMYVYASKTDTYHTSNWAGLYPEDELKEIEELVKIGEKTKCYYVWSVHLGSFFNGLDIATNPSLYETRYNQLVAKFTQLYNVGVRKFDILNDDFGSGSHADVVTLLNDLTENFIEPKGCEPITYCPQGYNEAWSKWSNTVNELPTLKNLDDSIMIYWTGADVNSPITQSTVDYVSEKTGGQPVAYWLNYPVNEHAKSGVFLGNIDHYARDGVSGLTAAVSNPSRFGQSNKVALFQLAALFWNNSNYSEHSEDVWLDSFNYLEEGVEDAYRTIGRNLANCPNSSRVGAGFPESEYIKENLEAVLAAVANGESVAELEDTEILLDEFGNILDAIETFRNDCKNTDLVAELDPWLNSLTDAVVAAEGSLKSIIALEKENLADAWSNFAKASKAFQTWDSYLSASDISNPALGGSKRIQPFAAELVSYVESTLTPIFDANYSGQSLYAVIGGQKKSMDDNAAKMFDGNENTYTQWDVDQKKDDYFGVDLGVVKKVTDISIVQANSDTHHDYFHKAVLEYSEDGKNFTQLGDLYNDTYRIQLENLDIQARYVRFRLVQTGADSGKANHWTHVREFTVNKQAPDGDRVYTNVEAYAKQPLTIEGKEYSLRDLGTVTLKDGEYLGMKFKDLVSASEITFEGTDGVSVYYSENGTEWTKVTSNTKNVLVKYVRINGAASFELDKFGVTVESTKANPELLETNLTNGVKDGSWENVFDGNTSTYVWTNENQTAGDYITFDLGAEIKLYDLEVVTSDGRPRLYNAEIQISTDKEDWNTIAEVVNDNSVFEVPYRYVRANANGANARYLRLYTTGNQEAYLQIYEILFNQTVEETDITAVISTTFGSDIENAIDGNLSTIFAATAEKEDSITYKFTEGTNYNAVSILQDPENVSHATVSVLKKNGYEVLGKLDESAKKFELDPQEAVYGLKISFEKETAISLYEIYLDADKSGKDDIGEYVEPVILQTSEEVTIPSNIALGKPVTVSGTSDGDKVGVTDGTDLKWDSDPIKGANAKENSWVYLDLGADKTSIFNAMTMKYFNKIYPTAMSIQVSNDAKEWTTIKELEREHDGKTYPIVTETFETAYAARYVRLFFEELNTAAAGNGVGVIEWEITGITLGGLSLKSAEKTADVKTSLNTAADQVTLPSFVKVVLAHGTAGDQEVLVPVDWNMDNYDGSKAASYEIEGTLNLPNSVSAENTKVTVNVIVQ